MSNIIRKNRNKEEIMTGWIIISPFFFFNDTRFVVIKHGRLQHETLYKKKKKK